MYEIPLYDPEFNYNNIQHAINLRKTKNRHSEFWHTLSNLIDWINHYHESFHSKYKQDEKESKEQRK